MENKDLNDLKDILDEVETNVEQAMDYFDRKYKIFCKSISEEEIQTIKPRTNIHVVLLNTVYVGILFNKKQYDELIEYVDTNLKEVLLGSKRLYDSLVAKIIKSYYASRKVCSLDSSMLFSILVVNKEKGNEETVSVLTNCILDALIQNKIYKRLENKITTTGEQAKFNYYNGIIEMVEMNYSKALNFFHHSTILSKNKNLSDAISKHIIICLLLKSDFNIPYTFSKKLKVYFELVSCVKGADLNAFDSTLVKYREELMKDNLFFIAQRLSQNVVQEGIRKIALVYSRISFLDISKHLKIEEEDVDFILRKTISRGLVKGRIENKIFISANNTIDHLSIKESIKDGLCLTHYIRDQMKYPKIEPLCFENIQN